MGRKLLGKNLKLGKLILKKRTLNAQNFRKMSIKNKAVKYVLSIAFSLFLFFTLMLSHTYIENPWNQLYEIILVFSAIFLLFWKRKMLILITCLFVVNLFWLINRYVGHPLDYIIHAIIVLGLLIIALIMRWNDLQKHRSILK